MNCTVQEIALWTSRDVGLTWEKERDITRNSELNHSYVRRPVHAHPDFYGFWADGNPDEVSESNLYYTDKTGTKVRRLPPQMSGDTADPLPVSPKRGKK